MSQNRHKRQKCEPEIKIPLKSLIQSHIDEKKLFYSLEITPNCNININFPGFVDKPLFLNLTWLKDDNLKTAMADSDIIKLGKLATEMEIVHSVTCYNMTDSKLDEFLKEKTVKHLNVLRGGESLISNWT